MYNILEPPHDPQIEKRNSYRYTFLQITYYTNQTQFHYVGGVSHESCMSLVALTVLSVTSDP